MSRVIKFRVWNVPNQKMSESFDLDDFGYDQDGEMGRGHFNLKSWDKDSKEVDNILMQFTGLLDRNGKEIFEGDIVVHSAVERKVEVEWADASFQFGGVTLSKYHTQNIQVLGNIYENPDLLEGA